MDYVSMSLPKKITDLIDHFVEEHPELGYTTKAEFVREAIRRHLQKVKDEINPCNGKTQRKSG